MTIPTEEITPEGSVAPVWLDPTPIVQAETPDISEQLATQLAARAAGIAKLMALGLTEEEAEALAGGA